MRGDGCEREPGVDAFLTELRAPNAQLYLPEILDDGERSLQGVLFAPPVDVSGIDIWMEEYERVHAPRLEAEGFLDRLTHLHGDFQWADELLLGAPTSPTSPTAPLRAAARPSGAVGNADAVGAVAVPQRRSAVGGRWLLRLLTVAATVAVLAGAAMLWRRAPSGGAAVLGGESRDPLPSAGPVPLASQRPLVLRFAPSVCEVGTCTRRSPLRAETGGFTPGRAVHVDVSLPTGAELHTLTGTRYAPYSTADANGRFEWVFWATEGMPAGVYRVRALDTATGRSVVATFRIASLGRAVSTERVGIRTNDTVVAVASDGVAYLASGRIGLSVSDRPAQHLSVALLKFKEPIDLVAECQTRGQRVSNGDDSLPATAALSYSSDLWYGVRVGETLGYVADTWTTRSNGLGLPACDVAVTDEPPIDAASIIAPPVPSTAPDGAGPSSSSQK